MLIRTGFPFPHRIRPSAVFRREIRAATCRKGQSRAVKPLQYRWRNSSDKLHNYPWIPECLLCVTESPWSESSETGIPYNRSTCRPQQTRPCGQIRTANAMSGIRFSQEKQPFRADDIAHVHCNRHWFGMSAARRTLSAFGVAFGATALTLGGCANAQQQVAGHRYNVPPANLIPQSDYPFFLPKPEDEGFIFILNPQAELRQQRSVLVEDRESVCIRANGGGYVSRTICGAQRVEWKGHGWRRKGDDTWWTYSPDTPAGVNAPFVSCHKMQIEGHSGLCSAVLDFGDLVLTISLNDEELPALEETYERAASLLRSWEV